ncbi:MAG: hypothetical protein NVS2B3_18440 [Vulcanimicrobiaceae bacterium]
MLRLPVLAFVAASSAMCPHAVTAAPLPGAFVFAMDEEGDDGESGSEKVQIRKDVGSIEGEVVSVDYRTSHFAIRSGSMVYDVTVLPSTDFRGRSSGFHGFTDIKKGAHLNVMLSQRATSYVAQIVHLP